MSNFNIQKQNIKNLQIQKDLIPNEIPHQMTELQSQKRQSEGFSGFVQISKESVIPSNIEKAIKNEWMENKRLKDMQTKIKQGIPQPNILLQQSEGGLQSNSYPKQKYIPKQNSFSQSQNSNGYKDVSEKKIENNEKRQSSPMKLPFPTGNQIISRNLVPQYSSQDRNFKPFEKSVPIFGSKDQKNDLSNQKEFEKQSGIFPSNKEISQRYKIESSKPIESISFPPLNYNTQSFPISFPQSRSTQPDTNKFQQPPLFSSNKNEGINSLNKLEPLFSFGQWNHRTSENSYDSQNFSDKIDLGELKPITQAFPPLKYSTQSFPILFPQSRSTQPDTKKFQQPPLFSSNKNEGINSLNKLEPLFSFGQWNHRTSENSYESQNFSDKIDLGEQKPITQSSSDRLQLRAMFKGKQQEADKQILPQYESQSKSTKNNKNEKTSQNEILFQRKQILGATQQKLPVSEQNINLSENQLKGEQKEQVQKINTDQKEKLLRRQFALNQESKQDYQRIFSKVVKEYSNEENYYFDVNQKPKQIYVLCLLIILLNSMVFYDIIAANTPKFCTNGINDKHNCLRCPNHAECNHFVMKCIEGYEKTRNYECKLNSDLSIGVENVIVEKIKSMQESIGNQLCFQEETYLNDDVEASNQQNFSRNTSLNMLLKDLERRVNNQSQTYEGVLLEFIQNEKNQIRLGFEFNTSKKILITSQANFSLYCSIKLSLIKNQFAWQVGITLILLIAIIFRSQFKQMKQRYIAELIYDELVSEIDKSKDKLINVSHYKELIVEKYKSEFNELIWLLVDQRRFNQKRIQVYRDTDGLYWTLF